MLSLDKNQFTCGIFIDLQKAFDTVDHSILLQKLFYLGIRGIAHDLLRSFLSDRFQFVSINGFFSDSKLITCGVPQGSTLGPLLFLIYINDLCSAFLNSIAHLFADDTSLLHSDDNIDKIEEKVNNDLRTLIDWLRVNKLSLNEQKTEAILFRPSRKAPHRYPVLLLNNHVVTFSKTVKYLGVLIDDVLSWNEHIKHLCTKLSRTNGIICKIRNFLPNKTLISIYYALFYSHIIYGSLVWQFTTKLNISKLSLLQRKCIRLICFSGYQEHTSPLFKNLKILKVKDVFTIKTLKFTFLWIHQQNPKTLSFLLRPSNIHSNLTHPKFLLPLIHSDKYGRNSLLYQAGYTWNSYKKIMLPIVSLSSLVRKLNTHFFSSY